MKKLSRENLRQKFCRTSHRRYDFLEHEQFLPQLGWESTKAVFPHRVTDKTPLTVDEAFTGRSQSEPLPLIRMGSTQVMCGN